MTACEEFDYSLFPFLHRGIQNADRGKNTDTDRFKVGANLPLRNRYFRKY